MILLQKMNSSRYSHKDFRLESFVLWYSSVYGLKVTDLYDRGSSVLFIFLLTSKELVSSLQRKIDESEGKYEDTSKLSEEGVKQEVPVIDQGVIIQLEAENLQLKVGFPDIDFLIHNLDS